MVRALARPDCFAKLARTGPSGRGDKADVKHELKVFPGTHHGFCFPERAVYDTLAAGETWTKIFAMWDRNLK
jgi:dienelactone hydrolase